jgi:dephospho-CoA kinase
MIICLSGYKGSGKDTLAGFLIEKYGAKRVALADPLKDSVAEEFGIDRTSLDDPKRKESPLLTMPVDPKDAYSRMIAKFLVKEFRTEDGRSSGTFVTETNEGIVVSSEGFTDYLKLYWTPRALAILKGSTNRSVTSNFWTNKAFESIENSLKGNNLVVVTDLRYKSEIEQFKTRFSSEEVVFVRIERFKESSSNDPSERDLDNHQFDFYIDNTGDLKHAERQMETILSRMLRNVTLDELAEETQSLGLEFK